MMMRLLYFGCANDSGHFLYDGEWDKVAWRDYKTVHPFGDAIDGEFTPLGLVIEGSPALHHTKGWTVLAWWDNSVDGRPGSHATFLAEGTWTFDQMLAEAKAKYPRTMARQRRPIVLAKECP